MSEQEAIRITEIMSQMYIHCCRSCAEALVQYFVNEYPEFYDICREKFYSIFPDMEKYLHSPEKNDF